MVNEVHRPAGAVSLSGQFDNHDGYRPAASERLAGREVRFGQPGGAEVVVEFLDTRRLRWRSDTEVAPFAAEQSYEALDVRPDVVAVVCRPDDGSVGAFAVLHLERRQALVVWSTFEPDAGAAIGARESTSYLQATVDGAPARPFEPSSALVGKRIRYRYSDTHVFEHIYLNPHAYCWHGVEGPERWIGDVDPATTFALDEDLYLFSWSETVVPFNGAVTIDLRAMRSMGRFLGWDSEQCRVDQIVVGAEATLLSDIGPYAPQ